MRKYHLFGLLFFFVFAGLMTVFGLGLKHDPNQLGLATKGTQIPEFSLPSLFDKGAVTNQDWITQRPYYLINFWGSWCPACIQELPFLLELSRTETIYGVDWKDEIDQGRAFIEDFGNPFKAIVVDRSSELAIGFGVYGAPETFLIRADGTIMYRYAGPLNHEVWKREFMPRIQEIKERI